MPAQTRRKPKLEQSQHPRAIAINLFFNLGARLVSICSVAVAVGVLLLSWLLSCLGHCFTGAFGLFLPLFVGAGRQSGSQAATTTTIRTAAKIYKNNCHGWQPFGALLSFT